MSNNIGFGLPPLSELISLKKKRSIITGAASGIGRAIAYRFAEAGSDLELVDINEEGLRSLKEELARFNVEVNIHKVDLGIKKEIDDLWLKMEREPEILVNNAGIFPFKNFLEINEDFMKRILWINLNAYIWMSQYFIKRRKDKGGVIINIASVGAIIPAGPELQHYDTTKGGVISLTRSLAAEYGRQNFRVNVIAPGGINTPGGASVAMELAKVGVDLAKRFEPFFGRIPMGRAGEPDEVARIALVLASDLSSFVLGAVIPVDGGFLSA